MSGNYELSLGDGVEISREPLLDRALKIACWPCLVAVALLFALIMYRASPGAHADIYRQGVIDAQLGIASVQQIGEVNGEPVWAAEVERE